MCAKHKAYFKKRLLDWKNEIMETNKKSLYSNDVDHEISSPDIVDQASSQTEKTVELRTLNRQRKLLSKIDKASMYNSIESRSPFLGKNIINFSLDIDINKNFKFLRSKYLLKNIFSKEIPNILKKKKKHGFALPLSEFFQSEANIEKYISAFGLSPKRVYDLNADKPAQINLLYSALSEREII